MPDIYIMNADGSGQRNITNSSGTYDENSCLSSDGKTLFYVSRPAGTYSESNEIWKMDLNTGAKARLTNNSYNDSSPACQR